MWGKKIQEIKIGHLIQIIARLFSILSIVNIIVSYSPSVEYNDCVWLLVSRGKGKGERGGV